MSSDRSAAIQVRDDVVRALTLCASSRYTRNMARRRSKLDPRHDLGALQLSARALDARWCTSARKTSVVPCDMVSCRLSMWIVAVIVFSLLGACDGSFPRDPEGTSERVRRNRVIRVGITEHAPWSVREGAEARGPEVELVRRFARSLDVRVDFRFGQQEALLAALEEFELDLVAGGLRDETRFFEQVGLTRPWFVEQWGVGVGPDDARTELDGLRVVVAPEALLTAALRKADAQPHETQDWRTSAGALAAPLKLLEERGLRVVEDDLATHQYVLATAPGENGWLGAVERYLAHDVEELQRLGEGAWR